MPGGGSSFLDPAGKPETTRDQEPPGSLELATIKKSAIFFCKKFGIYKIIINFAFVNLININIMIEKFTIYSGTGIYKHQDGTITEENNFKIELLFAARADVLAFCEDLKRVFNQESVALQHDVINSELI